jgi:hypothetical protein
MKSLRFRLFATMAGAVLCGLVAPAALRAESGEQGFDLKAGQEVTFAVTVADGKVTVGTPRPSKLGAAQPKDGEITIGLTTKDKTLYEQVLVTEKTAVPIDFLATGLVGGTKIDEAVLCGNIGAPVSKRIGAMSWKVRVHAFEARKAGATCE